MDKNMYYSFISFCMLLLFSTFIEAAPNDSLITHLPGFNGDFPSKHYSGYVRLGKKNLFYYFVVSERNPGKDPVVLWLNGGPGCSSFDGFVYEHAKFSVGLDRQLSAVWSFLIFQEGSPEGSLPTLHLNPYSWSKVSNIIYLDSPAGVGFSYSWNISEYITGDHKTATDTHAFLLKWFGIYPEFVSNPFYIAGESYAGIYVPTLSSEVVKGIKVGAKPTINFKGYMVGNGVCDPVFDGNALVPFTHGMALISDDIFEGVESSCGKNYSNPSKICDENIEKVYEAISDLNIYDILQPCYHHPTSQLGSKGNKSLPVSFQQLGATSKPLPVRTRMFGRAWPFRAPVKDGIVPLWPELAQTNSRDVPCFNDEVATLWLNDAKVRQAIHAQPENVSGTWELCTGRISYNHDAGSMIPYHKTLTLQGYRALIYSGDHDMCVPYTGTQAWTRSLGYKTIIPWRSWMSNGQVSGYLQGYDHDITFVTIKGAGHTVPEYKPMEALDFYSRWLDHKPI